MVNKNEIEKAATSRALEKFRSVHATKFRPRRKGESQKEYLSSAKTFRVQLFLKAKRAGALELQGVRKRLLGALKNKKPESKQFAKPRRK